MPSSIHNSIIRYAEIRFKGESKGKKSENRVKWCLSWGKMGENRSSIKIVVVGFNLALIRPLYFIS